MKKQIFVILIVITMVLSGCNQNQKLIDTELALKECNNRADSLLVEFEKEKERADGVVKISNRTHELYQEALVEIEHLKKENN